MVLKPVLRHVLDAVVKQRRWGAYPLYTLARRIALDYENADVVMTSNGESWLLQTLSSRGKVIAFDVGANRGEWAIEVLGHCTDCSLFCYEAAPPIFAT